MHMALIAGAENKDTIGMGMGDTNTLVPGKKKKRLALNWFCSKKVYRFYAQADTRQTQFSACW